MRSLGFWILLKIESASERSSTKVNERKECRIEREISFTAGAGVGMGREGGGYFLMIPGQGKMLADGPGKYKQSKL